MNSSSSKDQSAVAVADEKGFTVIDTTIESEVLDPADVVRVPLTPSQKSIVIISLCLGLFMASLDSTIVGASLKAIIDDLGHQELIPWIGSAYLMSAAAVGALYGKFADLFGRKLVWIAALTLFEVGSLMCGVAPSMPFLIAGRVIAGLGGGGIFTLSYVIISDIVSARDRGKYQTVITITYGGASCIAPLLGGVFADFASWRWSFYINLPFGFIAIATALIYMNFPTSPGSLQEKLKRIDVLGVILLFSAVASLVAGLQLGGSSFPWSSAPIISLFTISVILTLALMYVELKVASEPVIPASIFVNSSVPAILIAAFCLGGVFFAGLYYITLFFQVIYGDSSTEAGVKSIAFVAGFILCSVCTGFMVSKTGRYKIFFHIGSVIVLAGTVLTSTLNPSSTLIEKIGYLFVFGLGAGVLTSVRMLAVQLSVPTELIAVASAVTQTMGTLGGSVGVAIAGTIFNNYLSEKPSSLSGLASAISELNGKGYSVSPADVLELSKLLIAAPPLVSNPTAARLELTGAFASAFRISYLSLLVYPCLILAMTLFIREFSIKAR